MLKRVSIVLLSVACLLHAGTCGLTSGLTGREIAERVYNRSEGRDKAATLTLTIERDGRVRIRVARIMVKDSGEVKKTLMEFSQPPEVKGFGYLSYEYKRSNRPDDQWIYLPANKRVLRIAGNDKQASFLGSDFSYEDIAGYKPGESEHKLQDTVDFKAKKCFLLESMTLSKDSAYGKRLTWVDVETFLILKMELYDRKARHFKTMWVDGVTSFDGVVTATTVVMEDMEKKSKSTAVFTEIAYNRGLGNELFSERSLRQ